VNKTVIDSNKNSLKLGITELLEYKSLLWMLAWRDIKVRYTQTYLGIIWAILTPIMSLAILHFVFNKIANVDTGAVPHILFTITGISAWTYFSRLLSESGSAFISSQNMIQKIYFPKLVIPLSKSIVGLVDLFFTLLCLVVLMIYYGVFPGSEVIALPLFLFFAILAGVASGLWVSALTIRYRDLRLLVPFILRLGMFITPIAYPASMVPEKFRLIYYLNPMAGIIEGFRWSILATDIYWTGVYISLGVTLVLLFTSLFYFKTVESIMADII
jgi:lipopolysaccharide transport system permease protein